MLSFDRGQLAATLRGGHHPYARPARSSGSLGQIPFPIDFANKFPVSKRGRHCQSVVRCIRQSEWLYLQAAVLFEFCTSVFLAWRPSPE